MRTEKGTHRDLEVGQQRWVEGCPTLGPAAGSVPHQTSARGMCHVPKKFLRDLVQEPLDASLLLLV